MPRFVCLLRGVNVSGARPVGMGRLRETCASLGFDEVQTYLQSGNLVLASRSSAASVAAKLKTAIQATFGHDDVHVLVFPRPELAAIARANPFVARGCDPATLHATFFERDFDPGLWGSIPNEPGDPDACSPGARVAYVHCPHGYGRTKLNNAFFERRLKLVATTRNWKTTLALLDMSAPS